MANMLANVISVRGPSEILESLPKRMDFEKLCPMPEYLDEEPEKDDGSLPEWYKWRLKHWGSKWNADNALERIEKRQPDGKLIASLYMFATPWYPPTGIYDVLENMGLLLESYVIDEFNGYGDWYESIQYDKDNTEADPKTDSTVAIPSIKGTLKSWIELNGSIVDDPDNLFDMAQDTMDPVDYDFKEWPDPANSIEFNNHRYRLSIFSNEDSLEIPQNYEETVPHIPIESITVKK